MGLFNRIAFKLTILTFKIRDLFISPENVVKKFGIKEGQTILDYGCGPGAYSIAAAKLVGDKGKVYAVDVSNNAISHIRKAMKSKLNIEAIQTSCSTNLPENSVDIIFLFDVYHCLEQPERIMAELHRVLKDKGTLFFSDHHMRDGKILSEITRHGIFKLFWKDDKIYNFIKIN